MKYALAIILALLPLTAASSQDSEWFYLGVDDTNSIIYALRTDIAKGRPNQSSARVWVKMDHAEDKTTTYRESKYLFEVNCTNLTYRKLVVLVKNPNGTVKSQTTTYPQLQYVIPGSTMEGVTKQLCASPAE